MKKICVIGSMNVDCTFKLAAFHKPGETVLAESYSMSPGGKGGNQAVAASKLGCPVQMVGMLGQDDNGNLYKRVLAEHGIDTGPIKVLSEIPSGMAIIEVDAQGENRIIVVPGTNMEMSPGYLDSILPKVLQYDIFLLQLEIPLETVRYAAETLHRQGKTVILDPAPAVPLLETLLANVDFITPNRTELAMLSQMPTDTEAQVLEAAKKLLGRGAGAVIAKLGGEGCLYIDRQTVLRVEGFRVNTVDTTAAGDSFNAGFAAALAMGKPVPEALRFANAVGALSTMGHGAQTAMPSLEETEKLLNL